LSYDNYEHLVITKEDGVAMVRMNRPERLNSFNQKMGQELLDAPAELREDDDVRVVVLTGTGRGFCSGVDTSREGAGMREAKNLFHRTPTDELGYTSRVVLAWHEIDKPTIAAVNGIAAGGGFGLAMMQDLRIMARSARLLPIFLNRGMSPELGVSWFVPRVIGLPKAFEWLYSGQPLTADQALEMGVVNRVVEDDAIYDEAWKWAKGIAEGPPIGLRLTRRTLYNAVSAPLKDHLPYEAINVGISSRTEDAEEGKKALVERRKPVFVGR
jgi:2-(1,2-epoxy-1,2-dihydrophenyl)acetyl-CoA isomerase